mgnify:CR=1 FL=1
MALVVYDRVQETTTTTGTGTITLAGAVSGFQSFAVVGNNNTTFYCITSGTAWEVGIGTYSTTGPTLARTTVLSNSAGNTSPITLSGTSTVFCTYPAEKSVNQDASGNVTIAGTTTGTNLVASNGLLVNNATVGANYSIPSGYNAHSIGPVTVASGVAVTVPSGSRWLVF